MDGVLQTGSIVEVRGETWVLTRQQPCESCTVLWLDGRDRGNAMQRLQVIAPFDRPQLVRSRSLRRRHRRAVLTHAFTAIHHALPAGGLWIAADAHIDLHAYQLEPALAVIGGDTRLLLADAVGLGKTIQAGLILGELLHRNWITRALIVCPAGMRETWRRELQERFGIAAAVLDQQSIADRAAAFPPGVSPWRIDGIAIVSIDFIKRGEVMAALDGVPIDLLIVDEAHHVSAGTDRGDAIARLAIRSPWLVLVSATPHSGERDAFENLTRLGRHVEAIRIFRRRRSDVGLPQARRTHFLNIRLDRDERALLEGIARYARAIWQARGRVEHAARLVAITLARRACSSVAAIGRTLRRRRHLLGSTPALDAQPRLPWEEGDEADGDDAEAIVAAQGFDNVEEERAAIDDLLPLASTCASHSKLRRLNRLLSRIDEPVIVFTEYRDTLDAIVDSLKSRYNLASIHGGMSREARTAMVDRFNGGAFDVLVATDAAGEGLNLHHRCRVVIDFELPWNPLRLEQRIGRVDRIGQQRVVHAIRFFHGGTIEEAVLDRLELRQQRADEDLDRAVSERDVANAVLDDGEIAMTGVRISAVNIAPVAVAEMRRLDARRRHGNRVFAGERCWVRPKHSSTRRFTCLLRETIMNIHGAVLGDRHHSLGVELHRAPRGLCDWRAAIDSVSHAFNTPGTAIDHGHHDEVMRRIRAIRVHLARDQRREYQRSLFDGRAEEANSAREQDAARLAEALARIERAIAPADSSRIRIEVLAAWPERRV